MNSNIRQHYQVMKDHSNVTKMHFWMIQRVKKEVFGRFLDFSLLDRLGIAYCDGTKCFSGFGNLARSWRIIQKSLKCIFEWSKEPKKSFLAIFWTLVCWIDLMLHNVIVLNVFQHSTTLLDHEGSFKCHKNAFLNDPKSQKRGFWPFCSVFFPSNGLIWYVLTDKKDTQVLMVIKMLGSVINYAYLA